ncbi:MAG: DNA translocase FtsK, partial [Bosea sp. (in: a-proteobacteria)]
MPSPTIYVRAKTPAQADAPLASPGALSGMPSGGPDPARTIVRYTRTPDRVRQEQAQRARAAAAAAARDDAGPEVQACQTAQPQSRVRFGRTPDHLLQQVWVEPAASAPTMGSDADVFDHNDDTDDIQATEPEDPAAVAAPEPPPSTPFAHISDFAFWEGLPAAPAAAPVEAPGHAVPEPETHARPPVAAAQAPAPAAPAWTGPSWTSHYSISLNLGAQPLAPPTVAAAPAIPAAAPKRAGMTNSIAVSRRDRGETALIPPRLEPAKSRRRSQPEPIQETIRQPAPQPAEPVVAERAPFVFELPPIAFLAEPPQTPELTIPTELLQQNAGFLEGVLEDFNVRGEIVQACPGPVVTLYELEPAPGTKSSRVISLA